ncbi:uncharacterized protein LOC114278743 isoform X2 [Camellia sinensis]|uniref:uncharacterized protein LOC114278743 isoform X2 n=1 Tax=Camellia sinensis TaxID=4442 RepID=UPI001035A832|nr:uncharacterized protein LOC114278743 isoform X2 [Camellia sinensis]
MEQTQPPPTSSAAPPASPLIPTNTTTTTTTTTTTPVNTSQPYPDSSPPPLNFSDLERIDPIGKDTGDIDNDNDNSLYSVIHRLTGSFYSLKTISSSSSSSSSSYSQGDPHILRDLEITRALDNPNLVKCHAVFDHGTHIHFLLEYIHGQSLEGIQLNHEPFLSHLTLQILSGLSYLHLRKITHGDIRPSNLLVDLLGRRFKIAYFGLSRITKEIAYMSPERINTDLNRGFYDDVGYAGDIWGIGLCILQLYMGRYPIEVELEDNCPNIASAICLRQPPEAPPTASREFRDFIACCLQSDPAKRWTAHQLLQHPFIRQNASTNKKWILPFFFAIFGSKQNSNFDDDVQLLNLNSRKVPPYDWVRNAVDKMPSRNLNEIESELGPFSRPRQSQERLALTKFLNMSPNEFWQKVMEATVIGSHAIETPHQTVGTVIETEREAEAEAETETETETDDQLVIQPPVEPSLTSVELPDQAMWDMCKQFKSCMLYCSLFPVGYKFDKDSLVQMWIAEGLIEAEENERMEDFGGLYFDYMSKWEYVVPAGFDHVGNQETYRVGEAMASILEKESLAPQYCRVEDSHLADLSILSMHLSLVCNYIDQNTFEALKRCTNLRTLLLLGHYGSSVKQVPHDLFLGLELLRVLDLSCTHLSQLPNSVGNLKSLQYIDVSETRLKRLPEVVDCLLNLQTLRLRGCLDLVGLPKNISKLVNLRHLDLDIARQLKSMPTGLGNLTNLQTLSTFLVGREDGCRIGELKNMNNLSGSLCIWRLENVLNKEEAKLAALSNKKYLNKLELRWGDLWDEKAEEEEEILECLRPHSGLKELQILFYKGSKLPSWISSPSFVNIASITLFKCTSCYFLPSIGELPSLKSLTLVEMNRVRDINRLFCRDETSQGYNAFPKLEKLTFDVMFNLEEWTGVENDLLNILKLATVQSSHLFLRRACQRHLDF